MKAAGAALALAFPLAVSGPVGAATYHVDNTNPRCTDAGGGSVKFPYCTISAAVVRHHGPGNTVAVIAGTYREQVTIPGSGAPGRPFTVQAVNPGVVVDGAESLADPALWSHVTGDVWSAPGVDWEPLQVFADGARLAATPAPPDSMPARSFRYVDGDGLYVNAGGGSPAEHGTWVGRHFNGFYISNQSWVSIQGFTVTRVQDRGIEVQSGSHQIEILNNRSTLCFKHGIQVSGSTMVRVARNVSSENGGHGIAITAGSTGCVIEDNEACYNADPAARVSNGIHIYGSPGNLLLRNRVHHNQDTGLHFQTGTNDCISLQNCSWSNGDHGFDHVGATGTIHVGDVAHGNYRDGFSIEGNATGTHVYNCITAENGSTTDGFDLWVDSSSIPGFTSNYNVIWNSTSQPPIKFGETKYPTVAAYRAASGQDGESVQADPMFANPAAGDFHLLPGSPAIDNASSAVPHWPATDASGVWRLDDPTAPNAGSGPVAFADRGAHESPKPQALPAAPPQRVALTFPYPHPAPGPVAFRLELPEPATVRWGIFDVRGRALWEEARAFGAGEAVLSWDGEVMKGSRAGPGVYFARVRKDAEVFVKRFVRL